MYTTGVDIFGVPLMIFAFIVIVACCASINDNGSSTGPQKKSTQNTMPRRNVNYSPRDYRECPSCGAPYYDGYCDECGYPDINQGWLGEEY